VGVFGPKSEENKVTRAIPDARKKELQAFNIKRK
jgi:hypothetical protein